MRKTTLEKLFNEAIKQNVEYIAVVITTEGSSQPEIIINPNGNMKDKLQYYMTAYDDDLKLIAAKGKKDIRITGIATADSFAEIEVMLFGNGANWRKMIASAISRVVKREIEKEPDMTAEKKMAIETVFQNIKSEFLSKRPTARERQFIVEHIKEYEDIFETCMNGTPEEMQKKYDRMIQMLDEIQ